MLLLNTQIVLAELVAVPLYSGRVVDLTQTLTAAEQASLEAKLEAFEDAKGSQVAVLIVSTTQPEDIAQYAIRVVGVWKLGRKNVDDGVLLLVAKQDKKLRIEVGYGLEGAIPDLYARRIIQEVVRPNFKQGNFSGGINAGVDALMSLIKGESLPAAKKVNLNAGQLESLLPLLIIGGLMSGTFLRSIFGTFFGSAVNGGIIGSVVFFLGLSLIGAGLLGIVAFVFTMMLGGRGINGYGGVYPHSGGFGGRGSNSGGGFSGGFGGGFGGGGASGNW